MSATTSALMAAQAQRRLRENASRNVVAATSENNAARMGRNKHRSDQSGFAVGFSVFIVLTCVGIPVWEYSTKGYITDKTKFVVGFFILFWLLVMITRAVFGPSKYKQAYVNAYKAKLALKSPT